MALTRLGANQSINLASNVTGTLPAANGGTGATSFTAGKIVKVSYANPGDYSSTETYSSTSLTPCAQITHTAAATNSHFLIKWNAVHGRTGSANGRSQFMMTKTYTAGVNNYAAGSSTYFFYDHYGLYHDASNLQKASSYTYYDNSSTIAAGSDITFYVFLGRVGSSGQDVATNQRMQVLEVAQ
jgi:hypothetical protein